MRLALAALVTASCLAPARAGEGLLPLPEGRPSRGLCRYGLHLDCCYGWRRLPGGHCQPICDVPCKHGVCLGNNKCQCEVGFTGNSCSQDVNECGLKPRPCQYRCMNTPGSFRCYCLNGYLLLRDGSCTNSRTCALANCQNGCEEVGGEVRCLCPSPGLTLGTDMRSCVDINECRSGRAPCPPGRKCVNTFGSFLCKCQDGFGLRYSGGRFQCTDVDECEEEGAAVPPCSPQAECLNTHGSFRCRCKPGYRGNGHNCTAKPFAEGEDTKEFQVPLNATGETVRLAVVVAAVPGVDATGDVAKTLAASSTSTSTSTSTTAGENDLPLTDGAGGGGGGSESRFEPRMETQERAALSSPAPVTGQTVDAEQVVDVQEVDVQEVVDVEEEGEEEEEEAFPRGDVFDLGGEEEDAEWDWEALSELSDHHHNNHNHHNHHHKRRHRQEPLGSK